MFDRRPAHLRLLGRHPQFWHPSALEPSHASFLAGYLAHLWLDQSWIASIFEPAYGPRVRRDTFEQRLADHNLLRAYLDQQQYPQLLPSMGEALRHAQPQGWLPFISDDVLRQWRDYLADQLAPGAHVDTVALFARRLAIRPQEFAARLHSDDEMEQAAFRHVSKRRLRAFSRLALHGTLILISAYLTGRLERAQTINRPFTRSRIAASIPTHPLAHRSGAG